MRIIGEDQIVIAHTGTHYEFKERTLLFKEPVAVKRKGKKLYDTDGYCVAELVDGEWASTTTRIVNGDECPIDLRVE